jgi:hypothetical protein
VSQPPEQVASGAAQGFQNFQCMECAAAVQAALQQANLHGIVVDIDTGFRFGPRANIWSDQVGLVISTNGRHRAIRIGDTIFDNHNPNGIPYQQWLDDLHSPATMYSNEMPF